MEQLIRIGMDTSKSVFQLHGVDASERLVLVRKLQRRAVVPFFAKLAPEHDRAKGRAAARIHWGRTLQALGHEVVLMAPQHVKPYVRRGKHDAADAEANCEVMSRPRTRCVVVAPASPPSRPLAPPMAVLRPALTAARRGAARPE